MFEQSTRPESTGDAVMLTSTNRPVATDIFRMGDDTAIVIRRWRPEEALGCARCEHCGAVRTGYLSGHFLCYARVDTKDLVRVCFD